MGVREQYRTELGLLLEASGALDEKPRTNRVWESELRTLVLFAAELELRAEPAESVGVEVALLESRVQNILWRVVGAQAVVRARLSLEHLRLLEVLEVTPDLMRPLRREREEFAYSCAVAWLLDPARSPRLGRPCLDAFVRLVYDNESEAMDGFVLQNTRIEGDVSVKTEMVLDAENRVDIVIESTTHLLFVECKIDSEEGRDQLSRYDRALRTRTGPRAGRLVYLTATETAPESARVSFRHITFRDLLIAWLPIAADATGTDAAFLRMFLKSIAQALYGLAGDHRIDKWPIPIQRASLKFLKDSFYQEAT